MLFYNFVKMDNRLKVVYVDINLLRPSEYNPRKASKKEWNDLKESIKRFGLVDPLIVNCAENRKNIIIGGHFRWRVAKELGIKKVPVVYVNIPDIKKEQELNLRLNKNLGEWDWDLLANFDEGLLRDVGWIDREINKIFDVHETIYTKKIKPPIYEPKGLDVDVDDLFDDSQCIELLKKIEELDVDEKMKKFLRYAAYRFVRLNFQYIAEYYSKLKDKKLKKIFEELALVVIDYGKAIESGFVQLVEDILEQIKEELEHEEK